MELYYAFSVIIVLAALFSYVNVRYVKLPMTIGIMAPASASDEDLHRIEEICKTKAIRCL